MSRGGRSGACLVWLVLCSFAAPIGCQDAPAPCPERVPHETLRLDVEPVGPEFSFHKPVVACLSPDGSTWLVAEQHGRVLTLDVDGRNRALRIFNHP